ncbi:MAG: beta-ketoacyl-[acyl-carrier-protein] synthase family protein [Desulfovibrio sp.]|nr:beta-ketoacyl-[acyl-carrier-protein] synthase family protein [Desulfovibrio sp.]
MTNESLVITGMGAVTPLGIGVQSYWDNLLRGVCGIDRISRFDCSALPVQIAAEVRDFVPEDHLEKSVLKSTSLFMQFALVAAKEALAQSALDVSRYAERVGIVFASAMGGISAISQTAQNFVLGKSKKVSPHFVPAVTSNMGAAEAAMLFGIKGPSLTVHTACSAGGDAMLTAALLLNSGMCDVVLVMAGESIVCDVAISSLAQAKALSRDNLNPKTTSRPFDLKRTGFVIGEGGGALVLETFDFARKRDGEILADLTGYANTLDAYHITAPHPEGLGAARCMELALARAHLSPSAIGYINAHGTSTVRGDVAETKALKRVFGAQMPPVSSLKGATGHLMGAGGITEVIACVQAIRQALLPPTINYEFFDPECDLDYIPNVARPAVIEAALSNTLGFGGQNSSIVVARHRDQE